MSEQSVSPDILVGPAIGHILRVMWNGFNPAKRTELVITELANMRTRFHTTAPYSRDGSEIIVAEIKQLITESLPNRDVFNLYMYTRNKNTDNSKKIVESNHPWQRMPNVCLDIIEVFRNHQQ